MRSLIVLAVAAVALAVIVTVPGQAKGNTDAKRLPQGKQADGPLVIDRTLMTTDRLIQSAKMLPQIGGKNKTLTGYLLDNVVPTTAFALLGMKNGDVLREVNGTRLDTAETGTKALTLLSTAEEGEVVFARGKRTLKVRFKKK